MSSFSVGTSAARQIASVVYSVCTLVYWFSLRRLWVWHHRQPHLSLFVVLFMVVTCACIKSNSIYNITSLCVVFVPSPTCVSRVEDYWEGYKLFCYAYYSHSLQHESAFKQSKLGSWFCPFFLPFSLNFLVAPPWPASTMSMHSGLMDARPFLFLSQDGLCGVDTLGSPYLPIMHSAVHAHSCFH